MKAATFFSSLGSLVRKEWAAVNFEAKHFPAIAAAALQKLPPAEHVTSQDIVEYALFTRDRTVANPNADFGQPNITVHESSHFFIEALFWLDGTTALHQHDFAGAFTVLQGGSVHALYSFQESLRLNERLLVGSMQNEKIEILRKGDVRPIIPGSGMIHSLFHLDQPSVSIVVRTNRRPEAGIQYSYYPPGLAFDPFHRGSVQILATRVFEMLRKIESPDRDALILRYLKESDPIEVFDFFHWSAPPKDPTWVERMLNQLGDTSYAKGLEAFKEGILHQHRSVQVIAWRKKVTSPQVRLVLGLLLNAPNVKALNVLLVQAFPGQDPKAVFIDAMRHLAELDIGLPAEDSVFELVGHLLDGLDDDAILGRMAEAYGAEQVTEMKTTLVAALALLRRHNLFANVLAAKVKSAVGV